MTAATAVSSHRRTKLPSSPRSEEGCARINPGPSRPRHSLASKAWPVGMPALQRRAAARPRRWRRWPSDKNAAGWEPAEVQIGRYAVWAIGARGYHWHSFQAMSGLMRPV